jgi:hypothetical protein
MTHLTQHSGLFGAAVGHSVNQKYGNAARQRRPGDCSEGGWPFGENRRAVEPVNIPGTVHMNIRMFTRAVKNFRLANRIRQATPTTPHRARRPQHENHATQHAANYTSCTIPELCRNDKLVG